VGDRPAGPGIQDGHEIFVKGAFIWPARVGSRTEETSDVVPVIRGRAAAPVGINMHHISVYDIDPSLRCS
jgi:hypothetical protein